MPEDKAPDTASDFHPSGPGQLIPFGDGQIAHTYYNYEKGPTMIERLAVPLFVAPTGGAGADRRHRMLGTAFAVRPAVYMTARHSIIDVVDDLQAGRLTLGVLFFPAPLEDGTPVSPFALEVTSISIGQENDHDLAILTTRMPECDGTLHKTITSPISMTVPKPGSPILSMGRVGGGAIDREDALSIGELVQAKGTITKVHAPRRDSVMCTFVTVEADYPSFAGMSGGPIISQNGHIFALTSTSFDADPPYVSFGCLLAHGLNLEATFTGGETARFYDLMENGSVTSDKSHRFCAGQVEALDANPIEIR
jgi:hypothetical protein